MILSLIINIAIVIMVAFSLYAMYVGFNFMGKRGAMEAMGSEMFRYFTIDSNILMGICSLIMAIAELMVALGCLNEMPSLIYIIKLMGTSAVMLTLLVTTFFLAPQFKNPIILFYNSNLFFHAIVPILAFVSFVFLEKGTDLPLSSTIIGALPTMAYAVYYVKGIYRHLKDGKVDKHYDFYNFTGGKKEMTPIAAVVVITIAYLISILIWFLNRII